MNAWEYKVVELHEDSMGMGTTRTAEPKDLTVANETLKAFGAEGWELVSAMPYTWTNGATTNVVLWFKRPKS